MLEELAQFHAGIRAAATARLSHLSDHPDLGPIDITYRAKTTTTTIDKLRRQPTLSLSSIQDLAGIRLVGALSLDQQDDLARMIAELFPADPRAPRIKDRRLEPSWGYRAVHIIVSIDGVTVEVQVRTLRQDLWANLAERFGDRLGRGIRYGEMPPNSDPEVIDSLTTILQQLSDSFYAVEKMPNCNPDIFADDALDSKIIKNLFAVLAALDQEPKQ